MIYCEYCGSQLDDNTKFCPHCGAKVTSRPTPNKPTYEPKNNSTTKATVAPKEPAIKGFGLGFLIVVLASFLGAGIIGIVAFVLVLVLGDSGAKKGALVGFLLPLLLVVFIFIFVISVGLLAL